MSFDLEPGGDNPPDVTAQANIRKALGVNDDDGLLPVAQLPASTQIQPTEGAFADGDKTKLNALAPPAVRTTAFNFDWALYSLWDKTLTGNTSLLFSNIVPGKVVTLHLTGAASWGANWPSQVTWAGGVTPSIPAAGETHSFIFMALSASVVIGAPLVQDLSALATKAELDAAIPAYIAPQTLTDAATIANDASSGSNAKVTITADRTLGAIANALPGQSGTLWVTQDGTGGWGLTLDASQVDILGTLAEISAMPAAARAVIAWTTVDGTNFDFFITVPV